MSQYFRDRFQGAGAIAAAAPAPRSAPAPMVRRSLGGFGGINKLAMIAARDLTLKRIVRSPLLGTGGQRPPLNVPTPNGPRAPGGMFPSSGSGGFPRPPVPPPRPPTPLPTPKPPTTGTVIVPTSSSATPPPIVPIGTPSTPPVVTDPFDEQDAPSSTAPVATKPGITGKQIAVGVGILAAAYYLFKKKP